MPKKPSKPHDEFFKATFGRLEIALDYVQKMLPAALVAELDTSKLTRVNGSYVSKALQEYFSDLIFELPFKRQDLECNICLLFEHKSEVPTYPHLQLLRYILDGLEEQLKQKKKLSPIVPIVIYQGKKRWKIRDLSTYFGKSIPESLLRYLPRFDYHLTHVNALSDEVILALGKSLLVNALFMMKYIRQPDFIIQHPQQVFVGLDEDGSPEDFFQVLLVYFVKNTELAPAQVREFIEILPKALNKAAMSTYEKIIAEVKTQSDSLLAEERQRTAREHQRAEEEHQRAEEERQRATAALQREEEEHQRLNRLIYYLHDIMQLSVSNIAEMMGVEAQYVQELLKQGNAEG
jgi:hypothetical protein